MDGTTRRRFTKGVALGSLALLGTSTATASSTTTYVVTAERSQQASNLLPAGFTPHYEIAEGEVVIATGESGSTDRLTSQSGIKAATQSITFERESSPATTDAEGDPYEPYQWWLDESNADDAHTRATGDGATISIIDTGVDTSHPDLQANVNASASRLFRNGSVTQDATDPVGHGTHVAGIAGAVGGNGAGIVGTAPDAELVSLRVFAQDDTGAYTTSLADILLAIDHAARIGSDVANLSISTIPLPPRTNATGIRAAIQRVAQKAVARGTVVVASSGNAGENLQTGGDYVAPGAVPAVVAVGATTPEADRAYYSNYGRDEVALGAPGGGYDTYERTFATSDVPIPYPRNFVLSTMAPESEMGQAYGGASYAYLIGTSQASPMVAGTAALVRDLNPTATAQEVINAIQRGASGNSASDSLGFKYGVLDSAAALDSA